MLLLVCLLICVASVPLAGGRLERLADQRFERSWTLIAALGIQVAIISLLPRGVDGLLRGAHVLSYLLAALFIIANARLPGLWVIGLGTALNLTAIAANGGVMPAAGSALAAAGMSTSTPGFVNSGPLEDPKLLFLGDVFAVPQPWPLAGVFSVGDVLIVVGAGILLHQLSGSKLAPYQARHTLH